MENFTYDAELHIGRNSKGEIIPSITQLLNIKFPMADIKESVLKKAAERGTKVHADIENFNKGIAESCETLEGRNFVRLIQALKLKVVASEQQLVLYGDDNEPICYGTTDLLFANDDLELVISDIKTVSKLEHEKVTWQLNFYRLMWEIKNERKIVGASAVWVRDMKAQYIPLPIYDNEIVKTELLDLVAKWKENRDA